MDPKTVASLARNKQDIEMFDLVHILWGMGKTRLEDAASDRTYGVRYQDGIGRGQAYQNAAIWIREILEPEWRQDRSIHELDASEGL
jgi:hypothetical protein